MRAPLPQVGSTIFSHTAAFSSAAADNDQRSLGWLRGRAGSDVPKRDRARHHGIAREAYIIDTMLHELLPLVQSSHPVFAAQKMYLIQSMINFFIRSDSGQAAPTMPIMALLADLVEVSRQTAFLALQLEELSTPIIPTSGITVGALALARIPWLTWAKWRIPLQLIYLVPALLLLVPPVLMGWN